MSTGDRCNKNVRQDTDAYMRVNIPMNRLSDAERWMRVYIERIRVSVVENCATVVMDLVLSMLTDG